MLTRRLQMRCGVCLLVAERIDVGIVRRYLHALIRMAGAAQAHLCSGRAEMPTHHSGSSSVPGLRALGDVLAEGWHGSSVHLHRERLETPMPGQPGDATVSLRIGC